MRRSMLVVLVLAAALTAGMLLYPPFMVGLTGSDMGYHALWQRPVMVEAFGRIDSGRLLVQLAVVWAVAAAALLVLRRR